LSVQFFHHPSFLFGQIHGLLLRSKLGRFYCHRLRAYRVRKIIEHVVPDSVRESEPAVVPPLPFAPTKFQRSILKALDGRALTKQKLADEICGGEGSRLYRGGLKDLMKLGLVVNKNNGAGFYRPDRPPKDW
jgi:hypothetical protein